MLSRFTGCVGTRTLVLMVTNNNPTYLRTTGYLDAVLSATFPRQELSPMNETPPRLRYGNLNPRYSRSLLVALKEFLVPRLEVGFMGLPMPSRLLQVSARSRQGTSVRKTKSYCICSSGVRGVFNGSNAGNGLNQHRTNGQNNFAMAQI